MTVNQMRLFLKSWYPNSSKWSKKVNKMPDAQVIAIYKNPNTVRSKNHGRSMAKKQYEMYEDTFIKNPNGYFLGSGFRTNTSQSPDYTICPYCGSSLDIDERCDCLTNRA